MNNLRHFISCVLFCIYKKKVKCQRYVTVLEASSSVTWMQLSSVPTTSCLSVFRATGQLIPTSKLYNTFRIPTKQAFLSLLSSSPFFVGNYYLLIVIYTKHSSVCVCVTGRKEKTSSSDHIKCMCLLFGYSPPPKLKQLLSCSKS